MLFSEGLFIVAVKTYVLKVYFSSGFIETLIVSFTYIY